MRISPPLSRIFTQKLPPSLTHIIHYYFDLSIAFVKIFCKILDNYDKTAVQNGCSNFLFIPYNRFCRKCRRNGIGWNNRTAKHYPSARDFPRAALLRRAVPVPLLQAIAVIAHFRIAAAFLLAIECLSLRGS